MAEVKKHNTKDNIWFIIHGVAYDVTKFLDEVHRGAGRGVGPRARSALTRRSPRAVGAGRTVPADSTLVVRRSCWRMPVRDGRPRCDG